MAILLASFLIGVTLAIIVFVSRRSPPSDTLLPFSESFADPPSDADSSPGSRHAPPPLIPQPESPLHPLSLTASPPSCSRSDPFRYSSLPVPLSPSPSYLPDFIAPQPLPLSDHSSTFPLLQQALAAFQFILQAFRRHSPALSGPLHADFLHDLALILQQADLHSIVLDLLDSAENILFRYRVDFTAPEKAPLQDPARGLELPLLPLQTIASHRLLLGPLTRFHQYAHRLRFPWRSASDRPLHAPNRFTSKYMQVASAHRLSASVFVCDLARRLGAIQELAPSGAYAFASCPQLHAPVFLHRSECDLPVPFRIGQQVSFVLIHTPRGYQGRNIRPASSFSPS